MTTIAEPSVKSLLIQMRFGDQKLSTGTAFVVNSSKGPLLVTNRHNVTDRHQQTGQPLSTTGGIPDNLLVLHNRKGNLGQWVEREEALLVDEKPRWREHP